MKIMKTINAVPGGLMVVPLFIGMLINTFFPTLLKIGGFTEGLSSVGYNTVLGMYLFTVGTKMTLKAAPRMLKRGFGIMGAKLAIAMIIALIAAKLFDGNMFGFSTLALMVAFSDTNGGMFMALTSVMGSEEDAGTYVPQSIETGPFITMIFLVGAGLGLGSRHCLCNGLSVLGGVGRWSIGPSTRSRRYVVGLWLRMRSVDISVHEAIVVTVVGVVVFGVQPQHFSIVVWVRHKSFFDFLDDFCSCFHVAFWPKRGQ